MSQIRSRLKHLVIRDMLVSTRIMLKKFMPDRWTALCLTGLAAHELIDEWIRPEYGKGESLFAFLLGVAPNFIAAALIFPFAGVMFLQYIKSGPVREERKWFYRSLILSLAGLVAWEFMQRTGHLIFDWNDILATFAGSLAAFILYEMMASKASLEPPPIKEKHVSS